METVNNEQEAASGRLDRYGRKMVARGVVRFFIAATVLFSSAGTFSWSAAWTYLLISAGFLIFGSAVLARINPEMLNARGRRPVDVPGFDKIILPIWMISQLAGLVLAGLDAGRMQWSEVPVILNAAGFLVMVCGTVFIIWSMAVNTHFETTVRIQNERGHRVCTGGPYRLVRHPGYVGVILADIGAPLLLGSWPALIPAGVIIILFVWRTCMEDRMLFSELPGYADFTAKTRYRLVPGVW